MSLDSLMAKLRREYAPFVRSALAELEDAVARGSDRSELWRMAHRLAGTAGSYGFDDVGKAARALEDLLDQRGGGIDGALHELRRAINAIE